MVQNNPFLLPRPAVVSFSGGRTSGMMLRLILDAFGGSLPDDVVVVFCNTGKEREETLEFVRDCSENWNVPIRWLEYRWQPHHGPYYAEVDFSTASRRGEPFEMSINARKHPFLPNPVTRFCTYDLKVKTINRFARQTLGWTSYTDAVGLRADEEKRVMRLTAMPRTDVEKTLFGEEALKHRGGRHEPGSMPACPLYTAGITLSDVSAFWETQPFDLRLMPHEGNCDLCFLKGAAKIVAVIRDRPGLADWWIRQEQLIGAAGAAAKFRKDRPDYSELKRIALGQIDEPGWLWADRGGQACGGADECRCTD